MSPSCLFPRKRGAANRDLVPSGHGPRTLALAKGPCRPARLLDTLARVSAERRNAERRHRRPPQVPPVRGRALARIPWPSPQGGRGMIIEKRDGFGVRVYRG